MYAYFGHHKCATQWMARLIMRSIADRLGLRWHYAREEEIAGSTLDVFCRERKIDVVCYANAKLEKSKPESFRSFHMVREPRDLLVSAYFSHRYSHPTDQWRALALQREKLSSMTVEDGMLSTMDFINPTFEDLDSWDYGSGASIEVKFEDVTGSFDEFIHLFERLGVVREGIAYDGDVGLLREELKQIWDSNSFKSLSKGRNKGEENVRRHYRRGLRGDFAIYFTPKVEKRFNDRWGHLIIKLGYEM